MMKYILIYVALSLFIGFVIGPAIGRYLRKHQPPKG